MNKSVGNCRFGHIYSNETREMHEERKKESNSNFS